MTKVISIGIVIDLNRNRFIINGSSKYLHPIKSATEIIETNIVTMLV